jgi:midasin (ATPase involved in ribosome maturation)
MNEYPIRKRLKYLEDNINKDIDLLKEYEDELRYTTDSRRKAAIRHEIERQRESWKQNQQEYDELLKEEPSANIENLGRLLQQKEAKLDGRSWQSCGQPLSQENLLHGNRLSQAWGEWARPRSLWNTCTATWLSIRLSGGSGLKS